jgi:RimJ/RimL family protein N-acetyltransferase
MGIVPSYRGMGIGKALITATIRDARRQGFHRVELEVWANNVNAITLYEKVGFQHEGRLRDAMLLDGGYRDLLVMGLIFE